MDLTLRPAAAAAHNADIRVAIRSRISLSYNHQGEPHDLGKTTSSRYALGL
jgi:hypothetical protein